MALWLILLLVWLAGIPAAIVVTAVLGSRWHDHKLARAAARLQEAGARCSGFDRCGRRAHGRAPRAPRPYRRAAGRRPV